MRRFFVIQILFATFFAGQVFATTIQDFDTAGGTPFTGANYPNPNGAPDPVVTGPAVSDGQYLQLLSPTLRRTQNGVGFDLSDGGAFNHIIADFDFRITCAGARTGFSGGGCPDGFSFQLLDTSVHGTSGATGVPTLAEHGGLTLNGNFGFGFNTFLNPGFGPDVGSSNSLSMLVNGGFVAGSPTALSLVTFDLATGLFGAKGAFHHAQVDLMLGAAPTVTLTLTNGVSGLVITPYNNFDLSGVAGIGPVERRVGFAARCGDGCADYNIDNLNVQYFDPVGRIPEPSALAIFGLGIIGLGFMRRRRKLH